MHPHFLTFLLQLAGGENYVDGGPMTAEAAAAFQQISLLQMTVEADEEKSDRLKADQRDASVDFAVGDDILGRLPCLPRGISDLLTSLRLSLRESNFATLVTVYVRPRPMTSTDVARSKFYEDLPVFMATVRRAAKLTVHGDVNAAFAPSILTGEECGFPWPRRLQQQWPAPPMNPCRALSHPD
nr:unnamed protein product [Spirometra erinaceieuropaei]